MGGNALVALDFVVIALYVVLLLTLGFWVSYRGSPGNDLFLAGRDLGWFNIGLSLFGTNVSPSMMIGACGIAYASGMAAANLEWLAWIFLALLAMVFTPYYLATRISTMPEFVERRFGASCRSFLSWYTLFGTVLMWLGGTLYTGGVLLSQIVGWPLWLGLVVLVVIATSFTVAGGLKAVVVTDSFQAILIIAFSTLLTILGLQKVGGIEGLIAATPPDYWVLLRPADDTVFPWPAIVLGYPVIGIWFWCTDQTIVQRVLGARDIVQGQQGALFAACLKIFTPLIFFVPGIICFDLHPGLADPDRAYMTLASDLLPSGLRGALIAVLCAALVSTVDSALNSVATVFTLDLYQNKWHPDATQEQIVRVGRISTVAVALLASLWALALSTLGRDLFNLMQALISFLAPPLAVVFVVGIIYRKATSRAAIWTLYIGTAVCLLIGTCQFLSWPSPHFWPHYLLLSFYIFVSLVALMVTLSLFNKGAQEPNGLPALGYVYAKSRPPRRIWWLWGAIAFAMFVLYFVFN